MTDFLMVVVYLTGLMVYFNMHTRTPKPQQELAAMDRGYIAWLERRRGNLRGLDMDAPDPRDIVAIEDLNLGIHEEVEHFTNELWLSNAGEQHARIILEDYLSH